MKETENAPVLENKAELPREAEPAAPKSDVDEIVQAHKRRTALVIYLMILFVAAFVFVVISMISQNNKLKDRGDSALDRAKNYYEQNLELTEKNKALTEEKNTLTAQLDAAHEDQRTLSEEAEGLTAELARLQEEKNALQQRYDDEAAATKQLLLALNALNDDDAEAFAAAMAALEPIADKLTPEGSTLYQSMVEDIEPTDQ